MKITINEFGIKPFSYKRLIKKYINNIKYDKITGSVSLQHGNEDLFTFHYGDPRMKRLTAENVEVGDMLFYDRMYQEYVIVKHSAIGTVLADYDTKRYETNFDTYIGTFDGMAHFVSNRDAVSNNPLFSDDVAATSCFYRIEIDNTKDGSITFSVSNGNATITDAVVSWNAGDTMTDITALFAANKKNCINFAELADNKGVGVEVGGYNDNTFTASAMVNCEVIDCSGFAFMRSQNPSAPEVGGDFNPSLAYSYLGKGVHHNFVSATARSILGSSLIGSSTVMIGNTGQDYSYRTGGKFVQWKAWASTSGNVEFVADGVNGSASNSREKVMTKAAFEANVVVSATGDALKMYQYYNALFNNQGDDYATMRESYEAMYGKMTSLYDAYLMSHMIDVAANTGITATMRNKGDYQTEVKADCMNVNYDYKIIPAYPPEYNAKKFALENSEGFSKGRYYHAEPGDLGLIFRDDIMPIINTNINTIGQGVTLTNSLYRGSSADYSYLSSWCFYGARG